MVDEVSDEMISDVFGGDRKKASDGTRVILPKIASKTNEVKVADFDKKKVASKMTAREREELLIENFAGLQHAMTNMSIKFGMLADNISKLLGIFETASKDIALKGDEGNKELVSKIDSLLEQNKMFAKGLVLIEGKLRGGAAPQQQRPDMASGMPSRPVVPCRPRMLPNS